MTVDKKESEFKIFLMDFFSIEIFVLGFFPPYNMHGMKPLALSLLVSPEVALSLFVAFKLFMFLFGCAI